MKNVDKKGKYDEIFSSNISSDTASMLEQMMRKRENLLGKDGLEIWLTYACKAHVQLERCPAVHLVRCHFLWTFSQLFSYLLTR